MTDVSREILGDQSAGRNSDAIADPDNSQDFTVDWTVEFIGSHNELFASDETEQFHH